MTDYVFGTMNIEEEVETLKVVSDKGMDLLTGFNHISKDYSDKKIIDVFQIDKCIKFEKKAGKYYWWYTLKSHYRIEDKSEYDKMALNAKIDFLAMETGVDLDE